MSDAWHFIKYLGEHVWLGFRFGLKQVCVSVEYIFACFRLNSGIKITKPLIGLEVISQHSPTCKFNGPQNSENNPPTHPQTCERVKQTIKVNHPSKGCCLLGELKHSVFHAFWLLYLLSISCVPLVSFKHSSSRHEDKDMQHWSVFHFMIQI